MWPIDWLANWREAVASGQQELTFRAAGPDAFAKLAQRFARLIEAGEEDPLLVQLAPLIAGRSLIDVGAGAGRHAIPLARLASEVTAVEPSPAMLAALGRLAAQRGVANLRVVAGGWPAAAVEPADVVLCAHVVQFVADVEPFIRRLAACARLAVVLAIRHDPIFMPLLRLADGFPDAARPREATFLDLYNLLFQLGYTPNVHFFTRTMQVGDFADPEAAVAQAAQALRMPADRLRSAVLARLVRSEDGTWNWPPERIREAMIWWEPGEAG